MPAARASKAAAEAVADTAKDLALEWALRQAFTHGKWAHVPALVERANLPPEVTDALLEGYERANS